MRYLPAVLVLSLFCGCQAPEEKAAAKPATSAKSPGSQAAAKPRNEDRPKPPPDYGDVAAALEALSKGLAGDDQAAVRSATAWLAKQGSSAVGPAAAEVQDSSNDLRFRLACLNVLGYLGPPAASAVIEATRSETPQIQAKAVDVLGSIHPSSSEIVNRLIEVLDDNDPNLQRTAAGSLGRIGKPAERAAPKLQEILNSDADESLRGAAKTALKQIDPRIGFGK